MVGMFVCLCLTSKKPSEREFFVPAGMDLGVKLLNCFDDGVGKIMRKTARPSSGMDSSNPHRWRGEQLHHHGDRVC
jgi:hypothetical protein